MPAGTAPSRLDRRALNRTLLERQLLYERQPRSPLEAVEHLTGIQSQVPLSPYFALWSRLEGFRPEQLGELIRTGGVVRLAAMRSTIHLVAATDCLWLRQVLMPANLAALRGSVGVALDGLDLDEIAAAGREMVDNEPVSLSVLGQRLSTSWADRPPAALARAVRALVPLVQVPPRGVWGAGGQALHTSAESWLRRRAAREGTVEDLLMRYLAGFGPASVADLQAWSGLTRLREVVDRTRTRLRTFRDESGAELFDLPDAPLVPADRPAPVRFLAEFDPATVSHADRTRIVANEHRRRMMTANGVIPGTVLVDGFVRGSWRFVGRPKRATLHVELFARTASRDVAAITAEGVQLMDFAGRDGGDVVVQTAP